MPETAPRIGTPASINERLDEHTDPIDVEPFDDMTSDTRRSVYAKSYLVGNNWHHCPSSKSTVADLATLR